MITIDDERLPPEQGAMEEDTVDDAKSFLLDSLQLGLRRGEGMGGDANYSISSGEAIDES